MAAALKVAQDIERQEEEELFKKALEESESLANETKTDEDEEMKMIQQAIEMSRIEEDDRLRKLREAEGKGEEMIEPKEKIQPNYQHSVV